MTMDYLNILMIQYKQLNKFLNVIKWAKVLSRSIAKASLTSLLPISRPHSSMSKVITNQKAKIYTWTTICQRQMTFRALSAKPLTHHRISRMK